MTDVKDGHDAVGVIDLVDYPVVANAQAPPLASCQLETTGRPGVLGKGSDRVSDPLVAFAGQACQFLLGASKDPKLIGHIRRRSISATA